ncbi:malate dehydrogenase [Porphyromonas levii]|nr:malate dehydrogenase [Porphyromonas levii]
MFLLGRLFVFFTMMSIPTFVTDQPLVVLGATGRLASEMTFYALLERFSPHIVLCGSSMERLQGLKDEIEESGFGDIQIDLSLSIPEAVANGGYILFAKSVPGGAKTREEMLLQNAPFALEAGRAIANVKDKVTRVVCVSNPSDLMGLMLLVHSELHPEKVMSLSALDTERFRRTLKRRYMVKEDDLESVYTLGSHDTLMAPMLDMARIKGELLNLSSGEKETIVSEVRRSGIGIYKQRGQTAYQSPAIHCLRILMATDEHPFIVPTARYHHSTRYPYTFGSLLTRVDSKGCHHLPCCVSREDIVRLDGAFESIRVMRDRLIEEGFLPATEEWGGVLQEVKELVCVK